MYAGSIALDTSVFGGTSVFTAGLDFECEGSERKLFQCAANTSTEECDPFQSAAVLCYGMYMKEYQSLKVIIYFIAAYTL